MTAAEAKCLNRPVISSKTPGKQVVKLLFAGPWGINGNG